jgi:hypothetical protein
MNTDMHILYQHLFNKDSLEEVDLQNLEEFIQQYPYYPPGHFLLTQKYRSLENKKYAAQAGQTAVFFNNPHWLNWLLTKTALQPATDSILNETGLGEATIRDEAQVLVLQEVIIDAELQEEMVETPEYPHVQDTLIESISTPEGTEEPVEDNPQPALNMVEIAEIYEEHIVKDETGEQSISETIVSIVQIDSDEDIASNTEEVVPHPEALQEISVTEQDINSNGTGLRQSPDIEEQLVGETNENLSSQTDFTGNGGAEEGQVDSSELEIEIGAAPENELINDLLESTPEPTEPAIQERADEVVDIEQPFISLGNQPEYSNAEAFSSEEPAPIEEGPAAEAPSNDEVIAATNDTGKEIPAQELLIPIEPLYTVDYFASQGIKLTAEEETKDELGQKLKSFTEWLKTMKRIHPDKISKEVDAITNEKIQHIAEFSNEAGDILTEAMAEVYAKQGLRSKAVEVYEKLSLLNPDKRYYFAARIAELKDS